MRTALPAWLLGLPLLGACALPPTGLQRAQQTAQDFNTDTRFGRGDLVMTRVDAPARELYAKHHAAWGSGVRVADVEMAGVKAHGDADVDVFVRVAWYRMDQQELRSTTLKQAWHSKSDAWMLVSEERFEGDPGLLGDTVVTETPAEPRPAPQFPTVRLTGQTGQAGSGDVAGE